MSAIGSISFGSISFGVSKDFVYRFFRQICRVIPLGRRETVYTPTLLSNIAKRSFSGMAYPRLEKLNLKYNRATDYEQERTPEKIMSPITSLTLLQGQLCQCN